MKTLEIEEKTVDEAINQALTRLQITRDQISVEILEEGTRGLFGIGSKPAKIRVSYGHDGSEPQDTAPPSQPHTQETASSFAVDSQQHPSAPDRSPENQTPQQPERVIDQEELDHIVASAKEALKVLLQHLQITYTVEVKKRDDQILLNIHCDNENFLIGRRGTTLDAVQYLVNRIANKNAKEKVQVVLDTSNYRVNRKERLQKLALKLSRKVKMTGKPVTVSPMNPHDRRIIHLTLQDDPTVKTMSKGSGFMRRITISSSKNSNRSRNKR